MLGGGGGDVCGRKVLRVSFLFGGVWLLSCLLLAFVVDAIVAPFVCKQFMDGRVVLHFALSASGER